ncbi:CDP-archaeol synthase [Nannocystaceae bacterium ST9]
MTGEYGTIAQALWLALPVTLAGLTHVIAIKRDLLAELARIRLDGGLEFRGRPLFGANKTLRGAMIMIAACVAWTLVVDAVALGLGLDPSLRFIPLAQLGSLGLGLALGVAYIVGELPNSFIKRQLDIDPGEPAPERLRRLFWLADQVDSTIAVLIALAVWRVPSPAFVLTLLLVTVLVHPAVAAIMVALGLKRRIG